MRKKNNILPGFKISLFTTVIYLGFIVILPLTFLLIKIFSIELSCFLSVISEKRTLYAFKNTIFCSLIAAFFNIIFGSIIGFVLSRYEFFGKKFLDLLIDIPYALPSAISGIALTCIYAKNGVIGNILSNFSVTATYNHLGIIIALIFVNFPFAVRVMESSINNLPNELEEAAEILGANKFTTFAKVIFPAIFPSLVSGFILSFARNLGEYGAVIFISGNIAYHSEMISYVIASKLEEYDYNSALVIAAILLLISLTLSLFSNFWQYKVFHRNQK